jgi:hypothetical protein
VLLVTLQVYFRKASALKKLGNFEQALAAYSLGFARDSNNAQQLREKQEAEMCLKKVRRLIIL